MNILYNIGTRAYFAGIKAAAAFGHRKAKLMEEGRKDWATRLEAQVAEVKAKHPQPRFIWFHAASLGEFEQGRPLIEALRERYPDYQILQTFFSPSGYEVRKNYKGADIVCYLPYDTPSACRRYLDIVRPELAFFVKYEFWGNMLEELSRRSVPTYLISGIFRQRQSFFRPWGGMMRPVLGKFRHMFVQDEESRRLLASIGYGNNVTICGDTRFDRVIAIQRQAKQFAWAEQFQLQGREATSRVLVAGSSWPQDEAIIIDHFNRHPELRLIIAPHEIHEGHIQQILSLLKRPCIRYTQLVEQWKTGSLPQGTLPLAAGKPNIDCIIVDAIGFLSGIYRYGDIAYIGGGFGVGIHNTLEAAVYGMPVVFGPNHTAFREALGLLQAQGGFAINDAASYEALMQRLMTDQAALSEAGQRAGDYVQAESGATETIFRAVFG